MSDTHTQHYSTSAAMRIFYGCFFTSLMFSTIELVHLYQITTHNLSPQSRWLSGLYIISPILALGIGLGIVFEVILIILSWGKVGIPKEGIEQWSSWSALPIAATVLSLGLGFTISFYGTNEVVNRSFGAYFWLVPSLAFTAYLWHISRTLLAIIDRRYQKPVSFIVSIFIVLLTFVSIYFSLNEDLQSKIMTWPTFALLLIPIFFLIGFVISIFSDHVTIDRNIKRVGIILGLFGCVGVFDLSEQMNHQPIVKITILDHSLISRSIINALQPLYDRDGDGISGKMGGADCDDDNPRIHPGAKDIPLNGIDEDCYEGDKQPPSTEKNTITVNNHIVYTPLKRPNIILITIDTLRADHLHYHGYQRKTSPFLDSLSLRGLNFQWAFSTGAQTRAAIPPLFTGQYSSEIARSKGDWAKIYPDNLMLAERLSSANYHTIGIPSHNYLGNAYGLKQGFKEWDFSIVEFFKKKYGNTKPGQLANEKAKTSYHKTGHLVTDKAIQWIDQRVSKLGKKPPFFMWLHYFDPHSTYRDHAEINFGKDPVDYYDEEIRYTDQQIERLFSAIESTPLIKDTYFIIHSDHGEAFGDHGMFKHGQSLFNDQVHIPMLIIGPKIPSRRINTPVSLIDIMPTILEIAQVEVLPPEPRGASLLKFSSRSDAEHHPIFIEMLKDDTHPTARYAIVKWPWKLHYARNYSRYMMYNLSKDPFEEIDKSEDGMDVFQHLKRRLRRFLSDDLVPLDPYGK